MSVKLLEMRYPNVESAAFYEENQTAFQAPSSNNNGVEGCLHKLFELPQYALVVLGLLVFLGLRSVPVMLALALRLAVSCFAAARVQKYEYSRREDVSRRTRRIWAYSENARDFAYGKDVRLYDLKERVLEHFRLELRAYLDVQRAIKNREYAFGFLNLAALLLADGATYGILTAQAFRGMPVADFTMYAAVASALTAQMTALTDNLGFLLRERRYVRDFFAFLDRDLGEKTDGRPAFPPDVPLSVEFRDVSFRYPGTEQNVLEHFSLTIPAGQKLAVVGVNGAGKTTLVKLLTGLYQPDAGQILLSGVDAGEFAPLERWKMFAAVFQ